jgi:hypothetical protein
MVEALKLAHRVCPDHVRSRAARAKRPARWRRPRRDDGEDPERVRSLVGNKIDRRTVRRQEERREYLHMLEKELVKAS